VAIVGAGLAGLTAAYVLARSGCRTAVFEAADRAGGRVRTEYSPGGSVIECGGEFVDTQHVELLALARHVGLAFIDIGGAAEAPFGGAYLFGGQRYDEAQFDAALAALAPRINADAARCSARASRRRHTPDDVHFDRITIAEYLDSLDTEPWVRAALETAYVTVYGLDAGEQSSLNLLSLIAPVDPGEPSVFGTSDERYKLRDGTGRLVDALAAALDAHVYPGHRLVRLRRAATGACRLTLERGAGAVDVEADAVVLALPFTLLRQVDTTGVFSPAKQRAIDSLGYGTNSKLMLGMRQRVWRDLGSDGGLYTDRAFQSTWDSSRCRVADPAIYTYYLGGQEGLRVGEGRPEDQARRYAALTDDVFPGFAAAWTGFVRRVDWAREPFALGSYTCYRPGQWTTIAGDEATTEGCVYFAGEHCATDSQGYLDGAVGTGRQAAARILRRMT
jgi:monoamine oxidase